MRITAFFTTKLLRGGLQAVSSETNILPQHICLLLQQHTDKVHVLEHNCEPVIADAIVTAKKGILIGVRVADCVPVLLFDRRNSVIGAVHAGWRGTASGIVMKAIRTLAARFGSQPDDLLIAIGQSIQSCCYEVGLEVIDAVRDASGNGVFWNKRDNKYHLDLPAANRYQALSEGIIDNNIWMSQECTCCLPDKYYSYRYSRGPTGRQYGFIGIVR